MLETIMDYYKNMSTFGIFIFIFILNVILMFLILTIKNPDMHWNMEYNDFLKSRKYKPSFFYRYTRRLKKLTKKKASSEIKNDIEKASTFRESFIRVYLSKRKRELEDLDINELLKQKADHLYEKDMYERVVKNKLTYLSLTELKTIVKEKTYGFYENIVYDRYKEKLDDHLLYLSIDELMDTLNTYKNEFIDDDNTKKLILKNIEKKVNDLSRCERLYFKENTPRDIVDNIWICGV